MKILVTTPYFYPHAGGSQKYIEDLYSQLIKAHPGVEVDLICYNTDNAPKKEVYKGLNVFRVSCLQILPGQFALPNYLEVFNLVRKLKQKRGKYDLVNAHTRFFDNSLWSPLVAKYLGAKSVLTDHCAYSPRHSSGAVALVAKAVDLLVVPQIAKLYGDVVAVSYATQRYLRSLGVKASRVFHGGVIVKNFEPRSAKASLKAIPGVNKKLNKGDVVVTYLGRLIYSKGPQILLEAAKEANGEFNGVRFIFAGKGEALANLKGQKVKNAYFTGNLNQKDVIKLLANTDIVVLPTSHHEGFPIVLLEAGASSCAVVTTQVGGIGELIKNGKTGLTVEPTSKDVKVKLTRLIRDRKLRTRLAQNLHLKVKKEFDWNVISERYFNYINS